MSTTRNPVMMPAPRPFRVTRCVLRDREELTLVVRLADAALRACREGDERSVMALAFDAISGVEPTVAAARDVFAKAARWGAAFHRVESADAAAISLTRDIGFVDMSTWNALAWAAIEISHRLDPEIRALADYFVKAGYFLAHHGTGGEVAVKKELAAWVLDNDRALPEHRVDASVGGRRVAKFWLDIDGTVRGRKTTPLRLANSVEAMYEDLIFDIAWDDVSESLGRGRPRQTRPLDALAPILLNPTTLATTADDDDLVPPPRYDIPAGWYADPSARLDFRWWDGTRWTDIASLDGTATLDPLQPQDTTAR